MPISRNWGRTLLQIGRRRHEAEGSIGRTAEVPIRTGRPLPCGTMHHNHRHMPSRETGMPLKTQNSAGRYPLISRPTHISTSVGVVHDMGVLPSVLLDGPLYNSTAAASRETEFCLRDFGQIARRQRGTHG